MQVANAWGDGEVVSISFEGWEDGRSVHVFFWRVSACAGVAAHAHTHTHLSGDGSELVRVESCSERGVQGRAFHVFKTDCACRAFARGEELTASMVIHADLLDTTASTEGTMFTLKLSNKRAEDYKIGPTAVRDSKALTP